MISGPQNIWPQVNYIIRTARHIVQKPRNFGLKRDIGSTRKHFRRFWGDFWGWLKLSRKRYLSLSTLVDSLFGSIITVRAMRPLTKRVYVQSIMCALSLWGWHSILHIHSSWETLFFVCLLMTRCQDLCTCSHCGILLCLALIPYSDTMLSKQDLWTHFLVVVLISQMKCAAGNCFHTLKHVRLQWPRD